MGSSHKVLIKHAYFPLKANKMPEIKRIRISWKFQNLVLYVPLLQSFGLNNSDAHKSCLTTWTVSEIDVAAGIPIIRCNIGHCYCIDRNGLIGSEFVEQSLGYNNESDQVTKSERSSVFGITYQLKSGSLLIKFKEPFLKNRIIYSFYFTKIITTLWQQQQMFFNKKS